MATIVNRNGKTIIQLSEDDIISVSPEVKVHIPYRPPIVYHYTSIDTLKKILESKSLRFTNLRDVNDQSEYYYGLRLLMDKVADYEGKRGISIDRRIPQKFFNRFFFPNDIFSASFTENADDIYFWNSYYIAKNNAVSIGFKPISLTTAKFKLNPCAYGDPYPPEMDAETYMFFRKCYTHPELLHKSKRFIKMTFDVAHIKDKAFEPEKEWRLVTMPYKKHDYNCFERNGKQCRYIDSPIDLSGIAEITVGPGPDICRNLDLVNSLVSSYGLNPKIKFSKIPLVL